MHTQFFQLVFSFHVKFQTHSDYISDTDKTIEDKKNSLISTKLSAVILLNLKFEVTEFFPF